MTKKEKKELKLELLETKKMRILNKRKNAANARQYLKSIGINC
jgi:hypothetical protein